MKAALFLVMSLASLNVAADCYLEGKSVPEETLVGGIMCVDSRWTLPCTLDGAVIREHTVVDGKICEAGEWKEFSEALYPPAPAL